MIKIGVNLSLKGDAHLKWTNPQSKGLVLIDHSNLILNACIIKDFQLIIYIIRVKNNERDNRKICLNVKTINENI